MMVKEDNNLLTIQGALQLGKEALTVDAEESLRSAEILLQHTLKVSRAYLYAHGEQSLTLAQSQHYQDLLQQRQQGIPIAYLVEHRSFWTFDLQVSHDTLIPRPETELLVECTLALGDAHIKKSVLDMGTGSGAIALAIASERPNWTITACDYSLPALLIAQKNAEALQLHHIQFVHSDWFQGLHEQRFDLIVANPPYLSSDDPHLQQGDLRFEPTSALVSGLDGLEALQIIIQQGCQHLNDHGLLIVEHGYNQSVAVHELFHRYGYHDIQSWRDWQGHTRICSGRKNK
jgi:release factor glutamine methyltransferase